jgi:hypothetical protein
MLQVWCILMNPCLSIAMLNFDSVDGEKTNVNGEERRHATTTSRIVLLCAEYCLSRGCNQLMYCAFHGVVASCEGV